MENQSIHHYLIHLASGSQGVMNENSNNSEECTESTFTVDLVAQLLIILIIPHGEG